MKCDLALASRAHLRAVVLLMAAIGSACGAREPALVGLDGGGEDASGPVSALDAAHGEDAGPPDFEECAKQVIEPERGKRPVDVVWSIDGSDSMAEEADLVRRNFAGLMELMRDSGISDYRVVVIARPESFSLPEPFASDAEHYLVVERDVSSVDALRILLWDYASYSAFLRPDAATHFVTVSDDDSWFMPGMSFVDAMHERLGHDFQVHAVASPALSAMPASCEAYFDTLEGSAELSSECNVWSAGAACQGELGSAAAVGVQHYAAAELTAGLTFSICEGDWGALFQALADSVHASQALPCTLRVPEPMPGETLASNLVNLSYLPDSAERARVFGRVAGAADCGTRAGWYYDALEQNILLCPVSCEDVKQGGKLELKLGCETIVF